MDTIELPRDRKLVLDKLEHELHAPNAAIDQTNGALLSIAISMKRQADALERIAAALEKMPIP